MKLSTKAILSGRFQICICKVPRKQGMNQICIFKVPHKQGMNKIMDEIALSMDIVSFGVVLQATYKTQTLLETVYTRFHLDTTHSISLH
jgi:hypothetical protein